jgi:hypothetical protein
MIGLNYYSYKYATVPKNFPFQELNKAYLFTN